MRGLTSEEARYLGIVLLCEDPVARQPVNSRGAFDRRLTMRLWERGSVADRTEYDDCFRHPITPPRPSRPPCPRSAA